MRLSLNKYERLKKKKHIDELFAEGSSIKAYPLRFIFKEIEVEEKYFAPVLFGVTVSKKNFKRAVDRNLIKRRMREAFRLNKVAIYQAMLDQGKTLSVMAIYTGKTIENYQVIEFAMLKLLQNLQRIDYAG